MQVLNKLAAYALRQVIGEAAEGFLAEHHDDHRRGRVVVLCMTHNAPTALSGYVDIIELRELGRVLEGAA